MVQRVLVLATGTSPQVVTETFYKLATASGGARFVPDEIHVITTSVGQEAANCLMVEDPSANPLRRLCRDYKVRPPKVQVRVLQGDDGPLEDLRNGADSARAGDYILGVVRELTSRPQASIHFSIAGGRKTMGYLLGLCAALMARAGDTMSHVLVDPAYEADRTFFYPKPPPPQPCPIDLPMVPFVRLRSFLPEQLLEHASLMSMIAFIDGMLTRPTLRLSLEDRGEKPAIGRLELSGGLKLSLPPKPFALYWLFAAQAARGATWIDAECDPRVVQRDYLRIYRLTSGGGQRYQEEARVIAANEGCFLRRDFDNALARLSKTLKDTLGERAAAVFVPGSRKINGRLRYGLDLERDAIVFDAPRHLV